MIPCQRDLFDIPENVAYFNCAYVSAIPKPVRAAGEAGVAAKSRPWTIRHDDFFAPAERVRALFARLIHAEPGDIALVPATSYGLAVAARNLQFSPERRRIIVLENQYPNNVLPWRDLAARGAVEIVTVPLPDHEDWTGAVEAAIDERAGLVTLPQCHWADGRTLDLERLGRRCRAVGATFIVDATQSVGARPFDVRRVRPDYLVCAGYKWLLGPYSFSFLYVAPERQDGAPLEVHTNNRRDADKGHVWSNGRLHYNEGWMPGARRFDVGERANFALMPMAETALHLVLDWTPAAIGQSLAPLIDRIAREAEALGFRVPLESVRSNHFIGLRAPFALPADAGARLEARDVYLSLRGTTIRISPHLWTSEHDVDRLMTALATLSAAG